jgi:hypothetical protein
MLRADDTYLATTKHLAMTSANLLEERYVVAGSAYIMAACVVFDNIN